MVDLSTNTKIAFGSGRDGNYEIYVMNADGSTQTRMTNNTADDKIPTWSPDGTKITFLSNRDGNTEIYVMDASGTNPIRLTNNTASDASASWSPFLVTPPPAVTSISPLAGPVAGGTAVTIRGSNFQDGATVTFDGTAATGVIFVSSDTITATTPAHPAGTVNVIVTNSDSQADTLFNRFGFGDLSTDTKIAFDSKRDGNNEIYMMNADGTDQVNLTNNPAVLGHQTGRRSSFGQAAMATLKSTS